MGSSFYFEERIKRVKSTEVIADLTLSILFKIEWTLLHGSSDELKST